MARRNEFELIRDLFLPLTGGHKAALGLTDDVALIAGPTGLDWAVTTDAMVAGVHFFPDDPPDLIARKLVRVNLSDLAAKSAEPRFLLLSCAFPREIGEDWLIRFAEGLKEDCREFAVAVIGGDTVATSGPLTLSLTALGEVPHKHSLLRSNARSGDNIWVSGTLGDAALGLLVAKGEGDGLAAEHASFLLDRYRLPQPRLALGHRLRGLAHAAMDISDGLIGDLGHICAASGLGAELEAAYLPLSGAARAALGAKIGSFELISAGGDDYELLFTAPSSAELELTALGASLGVPLSRIGVMREGHGVTLRDPSGADITPAARGYQHFTGAGP
jgi:thiamine-monophosphate kinase